MQPSCRYVALGTSPRNARSRQRAPKVPHRRARQRGHGEYAEKFPVLDAPPQVRRVRRLQRQRSAGRWRGPARALVPLVIRKARPLPVGRRLQIQAHRTSERYNQAAASTSILNQAVLAWRRLRPVSTRMSRARSYLIVVRGSACEAASCTSRSGTPASSAAVMNACLSVCGPTTLPILARRATRRTIRPAPWRFSRRPSAVRKTGPS
jgi:hypothetical protein